MEAALTVVQKLSSEVADVSLPSYKDLNVDADGMMGTEGYVFIEKLFDRYPAEFMVCPRDAATFTVQWHAHVTFDVRPASML